MFFAKVTESHQWDTLFFRSDLAEFQMHDATEGMGFASPSKKKHANSAALGVHSISGMVELHRTSASGTEGQIEVNTVDMCNCFCVPNFRNIASFVLSTFDGMKA